MALNYLLLTGLHHVAPAAEHTSLLARIVNRPPLPFAARGVAAWPRVEAVLRRALAKMPGDRFASTGDFATAFRTAGAPLAGASPAAQAWLALRDALLHSDAELLAVADLWADRADDGLEARAVAPVVGRARSDRLAETEAVQAFLAAADREPARSGRCRALLLAARIREGAASEPDEAILHATLALAQAGAVPIPAELPARLATLTDGSIWLWALAHDLFTEQTHAARAVAARRPSKAGSPLARLSPPAPGDRRHALGGGSTAGCGRRDGASLRRAPCHRNGGALARPRAPLADHRPAVPNRIEGAGAATPGQAGPPGARPRRTGGSMGDATPTPDA